jgi:A/G-specific adenine glycosylase
MQQQLIRWFHSNKRDLPWRENISPYRVWVSEVMLQQTQVAVVIPYFLRWMERFPTVKDLADAHVDEVIKLWEGLGYYSRVRNLYEGAKQICEMFGGELPDTPEQLRKIKGIGPYTQGAILSFAFRKKTAAVDGNVIRVLTRYCGLHDDISKPATVKMIWERAEAMVPDVEPWSYNEGLIELGATVCGKTPRCQQCPIRTSCEGFAQGIAAQLPIKSKKQQSIDLTREVAVIECDGAFLIRKCPKGEIMQDLYEFPFREYYENTFSFSDWVATSMGLAATKVEPLPSVSHGFTKYRVKLLPFKFQVKEKKKVLGFQWIAGEQLGEFPFNSGHRRILSHLSP